MKNIIFIIVILLCTIPGISIAGENTSLGKGNELLDWCKAAIDLNYDKSNRMLKKGQCVGYLRCLNDAAQYNRMKSDKNAITYCIPYGEIQEKEIRVIVTYLENHPEKLHEESFFLAINALMDAYPCK